MNQILALREKRANLWNQTKAFLDSHRGEDGMDMPVRSFMIPATTTLVLSASSA